MWLPLRFVSGCFPTFVCRVWNCFGFVRFGGCLAELVFVLLGLGVFVFCG